MTPEYITCAIENITNFGLPYATVAALMSALSMGLSEVLKALLSMRDRFHKRRVVDWLKVSVNNQHKAAGSAYVKLIELTTGEVVPPEAINTPIEWTPWNISSANALFALEMEKMILQIQDAADVALGDPQEYEELYDALTKGGNADDILRWRTWAKPTPTQMTDAGGVKCAADTFTRLRQLIRRRLFSFQVTTSYRWQALNQFASVFLGSVLLFVSLSYLLPSSSHSWTAWLFLGVTSLVGGLMAPVTKDIVIALKNFSVAKKL